MYLANVKGSARLISPSFPGSSDDQHVEFVYSIHNSYYNNLRLLLKENSTESATTPSMIYGTVNIFWMKTRGGFIIVKI